MVIDVFILQFPGIAYELKPNCVSFPPQKLRNRYGSPVPNNADFVRYLGRLTSTSGFNSEPPVDHIDQRLEPGHFFLSKGRLHIPAPSSKCPLEQMENLRANVSYRKLGAGDGTEIGSASRIWRCPEALRGLFYCSNFLNPAESTRRTT